MAFVPFSLQTIFDDGFAVRDARLYAYEAGTTTLRPFFRTAALNQAQQHAYPVRADGNGRFPAMFTGIGAYDVRITDADGAVIAEAAGLAGDPTPAGSSMTYDPLRQLPTGALLPIHGTGRRAGYVRANGLTIGSSASAGTERADDDCYALFLLLWSEQHQVVAGGRGQTAQDDWDAAKTITVPSLQGRFVMGAANMGNANEAAKRLEGGLLADDGAVLGAVGGEASHRLTQDELTTHTHGSGIDIKPNGAHTPSGAVGAGGQHNHPIPYQVLTVFGTGPNGAVTTVGNSGLATAQGFTDSSDTHTHPLTMARVDDHDHDAIVEVYGTGGDGKHNTLPPFSVANIYIKL